MVALVVVHPVGANVGLSHLAFNVEAEAVAAILADLPELGFEPIGGGEVIAEGSAVLQGLPAVVVDILDK